MRWPDLVSGLVRREDLEPDAARWAMSQILDGSTTPAQVAGFAVALRAKGETVWEVSALAEAMLDVATPVDLDREAVDIVGSGADRANTVNVSTMAAVVAAAAGARVVKHGNRAASSMCGTADVLEAVGVAIDVPPQRQPVVLAATGLTFLFAPLYHPALRHAATARRELGIATTFNFLGPLANPARPVAQAVGVADLRMAELVAGVLARRGSRGLVFYGDDGLDELTTTTTSRVWVIGDGQVRADELDPVQIGIPRAEKSQLVGGLPEHNAEVLRQTLAGAPGPVRDIVLLNAAAALVAYHGPDQRPVAEQLGQRVDEAAAAIDSGAASRLLEHWVSVSQEQRGSA